MPSHRHMKISVKTNLGFCEEILMKYLGIKMKRILALILVVAALCPATPALASGYKAVVMDGPLTVYANASLTGKSTTLDTYSIVTVSAAKGNVAQLKIGKYTGYADLSNLKSLSDVAIPAVTNRSTYVFADADVQSKSVSVPKGFKLNVLYYNKTYAVVENNGTVGYAFTSHLTPDTSGTSGTNSVVTETYAATVSVSSLPVSKTKVFSSSSTSTTIPHIPPIVLTLLPGLTALIKS